MSDTIPAWVTAGITMHTQIVIRVLTVGISRWRRNTGIPWINPPILNLCPATWNDKPAQEIA